MEKSGGSRLLQMQARFQQRQKETKLVAMYEAQQARTITRLTSSSASAHQVEEEIQTSIQRQGKVRQMFEERRSKAGIDKSYPLQPIHGNTERNAQARRVANGIVKERTVKNNVKTVVNGVKQRPSVLTNGGGDVNHNQPVKVMPRNTSNNRFSEAKPQPKPLPSTDTRFEPRTDSIEDETFPYQLAPPPSAGSMPSPPPRTKKIDSAEKKSVSQKTTTNKNSGSLSNAPKFTSRQRDNVGTPSPREKSNPSVAPAPGPAPAPTRRSNQASSESMIKNAPPLIKSTPKVTRAASGTDRTSGADGEPCSICGRRFATDRLQRHEEICRKTKTKVRKPYDALKHRLEGTEAQPFIKQIRKEVNPGARAQTKSGKEKPLNSTWRQKHEDFIKSIRAAKEAQAYVAAGGKLSDLPPPPPSENPDYVQCPHCQRRFNQQAASRHIPQCANFQFNKTKPTNRKR